MRKVIKNSEKEIEEVKKSNRNLFQRLCQEIRERQTDQEVNQNNHNEKQLEILCGMISQKKPMKKNEIDIVLGMIDEIYNDENNFWICKSNEFEKYIQERIGESRNFYIGQKDMERIQSCKWMIIPRQFNGVYCIYMVFVPQFDWNDECFSFKGSLVVIDDYELMTTALIEFEKSSIENFIYEVFFRDTLQNVNLGLFQKCCVLNGCSLNENHYHMLNYVMDIVSKSPQDVSELTDRIVVPHNIDVFLSRKLLPLLE